MVYDFGLQQNLKFTEDVAERNYLLYLSRRKQFAIPTSRLQRSHTYKAFPCGLFSMHRSM
jgi:hypothetical protein